MAGDIKGTVRQRAVHEVDFDIQNVSELRLLRIIKRLSCSSSVGLCTVTLNTEVDVIQDIATTVSNGITSPKLYCVPHLEESPLGCSNTGRVRLDGGGVLSGTARSVLERVGIQLLLNAHCPVSKRLIQAVSRCTRECLHRRIMILQQLTEESSHLLHDAWRSLPVETVIHHLRNGIVDLLRDGTCSQGLFCFHCVAGMPLRLFLINAQGGYRAILEGYRV